MFSFWGHVESNYELKFGHKMSWADLLLYLSLYAHIVVFKGEVESREM